MKRYFLIRAERLSCDRVKFYCYRKFWFFKRNYEIIKLCNKGFDVNVFNTFQVPKIYGIELGDLIKQTRIKVPKKSRRRN